MRVLLVAFLAFCVEPSFAQPTVTRVDPPNWWIGMKHDTLQLMLYGQHLSDLSATSTSDHIVVKRIHKVGGGSYALIDVIIAREGKPGTYSIVLKNSSGSTTVSYQLFQRMDSVGRFQGFDSRDVIYLITPDRFANGDTKNDSVPGMLDTLNRQAPYGRHGGDIQGIINTLDYLQDLGVTALWMNPLVEDNATNASYHGYAATDLYRIDPRFGTNALYRELVDKAHQRGLKIIMDHVNNHISINHPWIKNLPTPDWLNGTVANHARAFHSKVELTDNYSDSLTKDKATKGWFTDYMPDLNQSNPFVATYLTQNAIWWIESTGLDGIREDTYPYIDPAFREDWCRAILQEYPRFNIVGEVWIQDPVYLAPYQRGSLFQQKIVPALPSITDFGLYDALHKVFADSASISAVFECLTKDFLFPNPDNLVTFFDNHDITRLAFKVNGDMRRLKLVLTLLLTMRGIPQLLYGAEIGMTGGKDHGRLRADFPGGWTGDVRNAFTQGGRTAEEDDIFTFTKQLLLLRKQYPALSQGGLTHFRPVNEVYTYFRTHGNERIMIVINNNVLTRKIELKPFEQLLEGNMELRDLRSGSRVAIRPAMGMEIEGKGSRVFLLTRGPN